MINIDLIITDLEEEYVNILAKFYKLGGSEEFLIHSGIKKT